MPKALLGEVLKMIEIIKEKKNISQGDLSKLLGYNYAYLSYVLSGSKPITEKLLRAVKKLYNEEMDSSKDTSTNSRIVQLQAMVSALMEDYIEQQAKIEKISPIEIRSRLQSRTIENLSKLLNSLS